MIHPVAVAGCVGLPHRFFEPTHFIDTGSVGGLGAIVHVLSVVRQQFRGRCRGRQRRNRHVRSMIVRVPHALSQPTARPRSRSYGGKSMPATHLEFVMLQVTASAAHALREARATQRVPDSFGVRVFARAGDDGQAAVALAFAQEPSEGDTVTEQSGTEIYVASELVEPLAEHTLDVEDTPDGPQLALVPQQDDEQ